MEDSVVIVSIRSEPILLFRLIVFLTPTMLRSVASRLTLPRSYRSFSSAGGLKDSYEFIRAEKLDNRVGLLTLHRPEALNAL